MVDRRAFSTTLEPSLAKRKSAEKEAMNSNADESVNFLFIGDWGYVGVNQTMIAEQMGIWSQQNNASFVIALGDNFYRKPISLSL